ncbi:MAG: alpha/beta fold hydrolase [Solirubrobacteraceae bacterium]
MSAAAGDKLAIDGRRIELLDLPGAADLPALLLLHEGLGSIELWRGLPQDLQDATGRRVVAFSRFGHGRSAPPAQPRTPAFFHDEALRVLPLVRERLGLIDPFLVGHSDGASIALIHAADHPVAGLVLLAPHVFVQPLTVEAIRGTRRDYLDGSLRERMARYHDDVDAAFWGWCDVWLDPEFASWTLDAELARVTARTLVIQGADDPYGTLAQADRIQARVPGARTLVLPGGHSPHLEHRAEVVAAIVGFMADA